MSREEMAQQRLAHFGQLEVVVGTDCTQRTINIHRSKTVEDMIEAFKVVNAGDKLDFKFISPLGKIENGVGEGVMREAYSSFWREALLSRFSGAGSKIPVLRNDLHRDE